MLHDNTRRLSTTPEAHTERLRVAAALIEPTHERAARTEATAIRYLQAAGWAWCPTDAGWVCTPPTQGSR